MKSSTKPADILPPSVRPWPNGITFFDFPNLSSTNSWVKENVMELVSPCVIKAQSQPAGMGRFGRSWISTPKKDLTFSLLFKNPAELIQDTPFITLVLAKSIHEYLINLGLPAKIKWPNDIWVGSEKICGILCETVQNEEGLEIIAGIGININSTRSDLSTVEKKCTSLHLLNIETQSLNDLLKKITHNIWQDLDLFSKLGPDPFKAYIESYLLYKGEQVLLENLSSQNNELIEGELVGITPQGLLNLKDSHGEFKSYPTGEVRINPKQEKAIL